MVARSNLTVYQGSDFRMILELKDESAVLMDLTGYSFQGQAKTKYSDSAPSFSFSFTIRDQITGTGLVDLLIADTATTALSITKPTDYLYDIEMITASGDVRRIIEGTVKLYPEVTK